MHPTCTVVIACHNPQRQLGRAVASVLNTNEAARVIVVAHNLSRGSLDAHLSPFFGSRLQLLYLNDEIPSPAGPFNYGIDHVRTEFFAVMGSDDTLAPGTVDNWMKLQATADADWVITALKKDESRFGIPTPPTRLSTRLKAYLGLRPHLDGLKDRLFFRSAPLGAIRTQYWRAQKLRFSEGFKVGEDVQPTTFLALHADSVLQTAPYGYLVHDEASDRVTLNPIPIYQQFAFFGITLSCATDNYERRALALKLLRIHIFSALLVRQDESLWTEQARIELADATRLLLEAAPDLTNYLSAVEAELVELCLTPQSPIQRLLELAQDRRHYLQLATLRPHNLRFAFSRDGYLRTAAASAAAMILK